MHQFGSLVDYSIQVLKEVRKVLYLLMFYVILHVLYTLATSEEHTGRQTQEAKHALSSTS
jgi:hypothetical protein